MRVEDEFGVRWEVAQGDAAYPLIAFLARNHFDWAVLPRRTLMTGILTDHPQELPAGVSNLVRLLDTLEVLSGTS